jgi:hypothetical protein
MPIHSTPKNRCSQRKIELMSTGADGANAIITADGEHEPDCEHQVQVTEKFGPLFPP